MFADVRRSTGLALLVGMAAAEALAQSAPAPGLLFHVSADRGLQADTAGGLAPPLFDQNVKLVRTGVVGAALEAAHDGVIAWSAPGNIYAQRGTLSFFWRAREPVGPTEFPIFRVGYADHSSWDMTWLRLDWNGQGFDAFVTDTNLARTRVSYRLPHTLAPDAWTHLAFAWDEALGVRLFVNGREAARNPRPAVYDAGLYAFGPHARIISPYQVQSRYNFMRGGDLDELRIHDRMLSPEAVAALARNAPGPAVASPAPNLLRAFLRREGWDGTAAPPPLGSASTRVRKVEFTDARDVKQWMWKGNDGVRETTWPGVYNRSRILGRNDYFQLPDWNVYSQGGKSVTYRLPDEPWNRLEIVGAAHGQIAHLASGPEAVPLAKRPAGRERTWHSVLERRGGALRFTNVQQETPIQEIGAYHVGPGDVPRGLTELAYAVRAEASADLPALSELNAFVRERRPAGERAVVAALPAGAPAKPRTDRPEALGLPVVHVLIPSSFRDKVPGGALRGFEYGWEGLRAGLDGVALDLPALKVQPTHGGLIPLNIRVKDPLWPGRDLLDVSVAVKPGAARTLWLDTRDRILPEGRSLYLTVASAAPEFGADDLNGAKVRLVFKSFDEARAEHVHDRFQQVRDNMGFVVEEHPRDLRLALFDRLQRDLNDLLRVDPEHRQGRAYFVELNRHLPPPAYSQAEPPAGAPLWAFRQVEDLRRVRRFINWWIDERQAPNGEFGGGLSDDTDLTQQWPGVALMGVDPDKLKASLDRVVEAVYANGMFTDGLPTIQTDELHAYEEGINGISEAMLLAEGEPKAVERLMATVRAYPRITARNAAGHTHFVSSYFSGTKVSRDSVWGWSRPYSYLILHPAMLLAEFNGDPTSRTVITELTEGWLAHAKSRPDGSMRLPAEIHWRTDEDRDELATTSGGVTALQLFWSAYRLTGDARYARPLTDWASRDLSAVGTINGDAVEALGRRDTWGRALTEAAGRPGASAFARYQAWRTTGDKAHLAALYGEEIATADRRMYMLTEGHWWSDRVYLLSDELQRSRLGGVALRRNATVPGHVVSWRFAAPAKAESVALLVTAASRRKFKVVGYNLDARSVAAAMTGWDVDPGRWRVRSGRDLDGDDRIDGPVEARSVAFQRMGRVEVGFQPGATVHEFELETPATPLGRRFDLGIGPDDIRIGRREATVVVHSLGAANAPAGRVSIEDASGRVVARAAFPGLRAPLDLLPKTTAVKLRLPAGFRPAGHVVRLDPDGGEEITLANNSLQLR